MKDQTTSLRRDDDLKTRQRVANLARAVNESPIPVGAVMMKDIEIGGSGSASVQHALNRRVLGFMVVHPRYSFPEVYRVDSVDETKVLQLVHAGLANTLFDLVIW